MEGVHPKLTEFCHKLDGLGIPWKNFSQRDLSRWLEARDGDIDAAVELYDNHLKFRQQYGLDDGFREKYIPPPVLDKYYPGGIFGHDKEGYVVKYEMPGKADVKGMLMSVTDEEFTRHAIYLAEQMLYHAREDSDNKPDDKWVIVVDGEGFGLKHLSKSVLERQRIITKVFEDNYPDRLVKTYIVNCPKLFKILLSVMQKTMDPTTFAKITTLDKKEDLLKYISADQLPTRYGGKAKTTALVEGGKIPEAFYQVERLLRTTENWPKVEVKAGTEVDIPFVISEGNNRFILNWEFFTMKNRITMSLLYKEKDDPTEDPTVLMPPHKPDCQLCPESDSFDCDRAGVYIFRFSNLASKLKSKTVVYSVSTLERQS